MRHEKILGSIPRVGNKPMGMSKMASTHRDFLLFFGSQRGAAAVRNRLSFLDLSTRREV